MTVIRRRVRRVRRVRKGKGFFGDILGTLGGLAGGALGSVGGPIGSAIGSSIGSFGSKKLAGAVGLGRKRRVVRRRRGRGITDIAKKAYNYLASQKDNLIKAHDFIKTHKLVSRGLNLAGQRDLGTKIGNLGYGRKRVVRRPVRVVVRVGRGAPINTSASQANMSVARF